MMPGMAVTTRVAAQLQNQGFLSWASTSASLLACQRHKYHCSYSTHTDSNLPDVWVFPSKLQMPKLLFPLLRTQHCQSQALCSLFLFWKWQNFLSVMNGCHLHSSLGERSQERVPSWSAWGPGWAQSASNSPHCRDRKSSAQFYDS